MTKFFSVILIVLAAAFPAAAVANDQCWEMSAYVYQNIPDYVYNDHPDSLLGLLLDWEDTCGESEPLIRMKILASIWDGAFEEAIYDSRIIDALIWRYDEKRMKKVSGNVDPDMASGGIAGPADFAFGIGSFDAFTTELADQLLPHVTHRTVEEFFCLFYSGKVDMAFEMLHGEALNGSDLRWYFQREISYLNQKEARPVLAFTGGYWKPSGELLRVGNHPQWGIIIGIRQDRWIGRLVGEIRPGRTDYPYHVDIDGIEGMSNRFDNVYLGLEVGRELISYGPHRVDVFAGLGFDGIKPFWEEDLVLGTINANAGFGYRLFLGKNRNWIAGVDYRFEVIGTRNNGGTDLSGKARSVRVSFGYSFDYGKGRRLAGVGF